MKNCKKCIHELVCSRKNLIARLTPRGDELPCEEFIDKDDGKHSKWEINCDGYYSYCKACGYEPPYANGKDMRTKYCPGCGARMDGGKG